MLLTELLKEQTSLLHLETEKVMKSHRILAPDFNIQEYIRLLSALYEFHYKVEHYVQCYSDLLSKEGLALSNRSKLDWLKKDVELLGAEVPPIELSEKIDSPNEDANAFCLGLMYVTEGSTIGGQRILAKLQSNKAIAPTGATHFYAGYGKETMNQWLAYKELLNKIPEAHSSYTLRGAKQAFRWCIEAGKKWISLSAISR